MRPAFPHARYFTGRTEWDFWCGHPDSVMAHHRDAFAAVIRPIAAAGQLHVVDDGSSLIEGFAYRRLPGNRRGRSGELRGRRGNRPRSQSTPRAQLRDDGEVPPVTTTGRGEAEVMVDTEQRELRWTVKYQDLLTPLRAAHFHGPAATNGNAPILVPIARKLDRSGVIAGKVAVNDQQTQDIPAGRWYINVHSSTNPSGEIRGQLFRR